MDEEFPRTVGAKIPADMTRADVEKVMETTAKVVAEMSEAMPVAMASAERIASGSFRDADRLHTGSGQATLYALPSGETILRLEDFRVTNGPALVVLLSAHAGPMSRGEVKNVGYVELGELKGNVSNQNYELPDDVDAAALNSVVIYCKPFHVIFSVAPLRPGET